MGSFLGGGAIALLAGEFVRGLPLRVAAVLLGLLVMLPAAVFPWIPLPMVDGARRRTAVESFGELFRDLKQLLTRREVWWMMALFLAPTGSFALTNQLGGVARDFHASDEFVSRMGGAVLSFAGATVCLLLPVFARWIKPLPLYLTIGTVGSLFTLGLLLLPRAPGAFAVAFMAENVVQALSFTSAVAICLSTIGSGNPLAATDDGLTVKRRRQGMPAATARSRARICSISAPAADNADGFFRPQPLDEPPLLFGAIGEAMGVSAPSPCFMHQRPAASLRQPTLARRPAGVHQARPIRFCSMGT